MVWRITPSFTYSSAFWSPANITTALWLDAADASTITQSSGLVSQINDKSGNNRNFTASSSARPTFTQSGLNGKPVLTFSGSQVLTSANAASTWTFLHDSTKNSIWIAAKTGETSDPKIGCWFMGTSGGTNQNIGRYLGYYDLDAGGGKNNNLFIDAASRGSGVSVIDNTSNNDAVPANDPFILSVLSDPASATASARSSARVNGGTAIENNTLTNSPSSSSPTFTLQIGATGNNVAIGYLGFICEIIITDSLATTATRQLVEGYLAWKWGLAVKLPSSHPYKNSPPMP